METTGLLDTDEPLKPFLEAAKDSSTSNMSTVRAVVLKVLSHPSIFCGYDQLKAVMQPSLGSASAAGDTGESVLRTLDLFSYGKYRDYMNNTSLYLNLNETQLTKLRQLTVLSVVQEACVRGEAAISYNVLAHELGFVSNGEQHQHQQQLQSSLSTSSDENSRLLRQVEQVVISCIYSQILDGRLCQKTKTLFVSSHRGPPCRSRDIPLGHVPNMIETLQALHQRLEQTHGELQAAHASVQNTVNQNAAYWNTIEERKKAAEAQMGHDRSSSSQVGTVRSMGWPGGASNEGGMDATRRSSSSRRQSKRSRGGLGGSFTEPFQRY